MRARVVNRPPTDRVRRLHTLSRAVEAAFGWDVDFAQLTEKDVSDSSLPDAAPLLARSRDWRAKDVIRGTPDPEKISTSYVERLNLSLQGSITIPKDSMRTESNNPVASPQNRPKSPAHDVSHQTPQS